MTQIYPLRVIAWKNVRRKLFRNIVLMIAVAFLVALLVFAFLFDKAVEDDIEAATRRLGADIVLVPPEAIGAAEEFILESKLKSFYMDEWVYQSVQDLPDIQKITYHVYLNTLASGCCSIDEGQVVGFPSDSDFVVSPWLEKGIPELKSGEVFIGSYINEYLGLMDTARLFGSLLKIAGHLQQTGTGLDHGIFMRIEDVDKISPEVTGDYRTGKISIIFIKVRKGVEVSKVVKDIRDINPRIGIMTRGEIGADVRATLNDVLRVFSMTILISSFLAIMLAWSTFTALTNERRREVGILRAIGAHRSHIVKIFIYEALIISILGGVIGVILGHYLMYALTGNFHLLTSIGAVNATTTENLLISLIALVAGVTACLIGAAVPVFRLAHLEPFLAITDD